MNSKKELTVLMLVCVLIMGLIKWGLSPFYQVTYEKTYPKIDRLIEEDWELIEKSNNSIIFGTPNDVIYGVKTNNKIVHIRCTDGIFQPLICRIYE